MSIYKIRIFSTVLALTLVFALLASCGGGGADTTTTTAAAVAETTTAAAAAAETTTAAAAAEETTAAADTAAAETTAAATTAAATTTAAAAETTEAQAATGNPTVNPTGYPLASEPVTYTVFMTRDEADGPWQDLEMLQWLEGVTNVHFEYDSVPTQEEYRDKINLMFASETYPDVLMPRGAVRWQDEEAFGKDGYVIDLTNLMNEWMPNCIEVIDHFPQLRAGQTASDGKMYGLPFLYEGKGGNPHNWFMEPYWIGAAGWDDVPNTIDEMRTFMYDIKAVLDSGDYIRPEEGMYVLGYPTNNGTGWGEQARVYMISATGAICNLDMMWAAPDMKNVEFMVEHPGFKETVRFFRDLYRDGLIDPDVFTMDGGAVNAKKNTCKYAMYTSSSSALEDDLIRDTPPANPGDGYACASIRPMTSQWNSRPLINFETEGNIDWSMITDKAQNPEILARWFDIFYNMNYDVTDNSVPNPMMFYLGRYGEHWTYTGANNDFWTFLPNRKDGALDDDGNPALIDWDYTRQYLLPGWSLPCGYYGETKFSLGNEKYVGKQRSTAVNSYPYCTTDTQISGLARMTESEVAAVAVKLTELQTYLGEQWGLFMSGQKDIETDWDAFVEECYRLGAAEITEVYQNVYDRWNSALD